MLRDLISNNCTATPLSLHVWVDNIEIIGKQGTKFILSRKTWKIAKIF